MSVVLITGASRGLGLALVRRFAAARWKVHAACREPAEADRLHELEGRIDGLSTHRLDVTDAEEVAALARILGQEPIDLLINNAGVYGGSYRMPFGETDCSLWEDAIRTNTMGPMRMAETFVEHVARSRCKTIVNISTILASIALNDSGLSYAYRSSKAGLNMVTRSLAIDLKDRGITVAAIHPGWVRTDMGGPEGKLSPDESAEKLYAVIMGLDPTRSGAFLNYDGKELPW
jgi:NAD(P)-dependent dehydrogenase (short-subunit alcohol dehydrogenase family)